MAKERKTPPPRKEPGIIGRFFSLIFSTLFWAVISLIFSILVEWVGVAFFWQEEGSQHSKAMLETEYGYLNERVKESAGSISASIKNTTYKLNQWVTSNKGLSGAIEWISKPFSSSDNIVRQWAHGLYGKYKEYILAVPNTIQVFFVRIALILFSIPAFILFLAVGIVDGLVERDLRRWGGGRESSLVYNLARKSIFPVFILACVLYLGFPVSVHPAVIIIPFAIMFGLSARVACERLKKYF